MPTAVAPGGVPSYQALQEKKAGSASKTRFAAPPSEPTSFFRGVLGEPSLCLGGLKRVFSGILFSRMPLKFTFGDLGTEIMSSQSQSYNLDHFVGLRIDAEQLAALDEYSRKHGIKRGNVIRIAVQKLLERAESPVA